MSKALLLIDLQQDYFDNGRMALVNSEKAVKKASQLLTHFRSKHLPVIHIQHISTRPNATFFIPGTGGEDIHPLVAPEKNETIIIKHYPNSFRETTLLKTLKKLDVNQLVIAGMMIQMCVDTTTRAATDLGFQCELAYDACATKDLIFNGQTAPAQSVSIAYFAALNGLFAQVKSVDEVCAEI